MPTGGSSSGSASAIRAGAAYVEIFGKDLLTSKLEGIKANVKKMAADSASGIKFEQVNKAATGIGIAGGVGIVGMAGAVVTIGEMFAGMNKFNAAMEEGARITAQLDKAQAALNARVFERVGGKLARPVDLVPEAGKLAYLQQKLDQTEKSLGGVADSATKANEAVAELAGGWNLVQQRIPLWNDSLEAARAEAKIRADMLNKQKAGLQDQRDALREQIAAQKKAPTRFDMWASPINDQIREAMMRVKTIDMSPADAAAARAQDKSAREGVKETADKIWQLKFALNAVADADAFKAVTDDAKAFREELEFALRTVGKTADQVRLIKLQEKAGKLGREIDPNLRGLIGMERDRLEMEEEAEFQQSMFDLTAGRLEAAADMALSSRGAFGGPLAAQLGVGDSMIQKNQLGELKGIRANAGEIVAGIDKLPALFGDELRMR